MKADGLFLIAWLVAATAWAVPARPVTQTVCMADGTVQDVVPLAGDDFVLGFGTGDTLQITRGSYSGAPERARTVGTRCTRRECQVGSGASPSWRSAADAVAATADVTPQTGDGCRFG